MATKYFCDVCRAEITEKSAAIGGQRVESRLGTTVKTKAGELNLELLHSWNGIANAGDICKYCIIDAFSKLDDRPRVMERA